MIDDSLQVTEIHIAGQQTHDGQPFPLVLECRGSAGLEATERWLAAQRAELIDRAGHVGAILFRGFPLASAEDFDRFVGHFRAAELSVRPVAVERRPRQLHAAHLHGQRSAERRDYLSASRDGADAGLSVASVLLLRTAGRSGGRDADLPLGRVMAAVGSARAAVRARLRAKGAALYERHAAGQRPGLRHGTQLAKHAARSSRAEAEARLSGLGYRWEWTEDGCLRATTPVLPAVRAIGGGRKAFFNQLIAAFHGWKDARNDPSKAITFGDGTPLDRTAVNTAVELANELSFDVAWQAGDVALVNNFVSMHGRRPFSGTRRVLASLVAYEP